MPHDLAGRTVPLRRLRLLGLIGPLAYVLVLLALRPVIVELWGTRVAHTVLGSVLFASAGLFGWGMYLLLGHTHAAVVDAERRAAALVERDRIARELHDSLAQVLGVTHLRLRALETRASVVGDERVRADIDDLATLCREAHRDVREAIIGLKDAHLPERTFAEHLDAFVTTFSRTSGVPTILHTDAGDLRLSPAAEVQVIRVIQEALSNIRKHACAHHATVRITAHANLVEFAVQDDGIGFDPARAGTPDTFGLRTMRERIESVGGRFSVESVPGVGTRVVATVPGERGGSRPGSTVPAPTDAERVEEFSA